MTATKPRTLTQLTASVSGLDARMTFADHRIEELSKRIDREGLCADQHAAIQPLYERMNKWEQHLRRLAARLEQLEQSARPTAPVPAEPFTRPVHDIGTCPPGYMIKPSPNYRDRFLVIRQSDCKTLADTFSLGSAIETAIKDWDVQHPKKPSDCGPRGDLAVRHQRLRDVWRELDMLIEQQLTSGGK